MKLRVLGGTHPLGRHIVVEALPAGAKVTVFNCGRTRGTAALLYAAR